MLLEVSFPFKVLLTSADIKMIFCNTQVHLGIAEEGDLSCVISTIGKHVAFCEGSNKLILRYLLL